MPRVFSLSLVVLLLLFLSLSAGCGKGKEGELVARVNGTRITSADLQREIEQLPFHSRNSFSGAGGQKRLVEEMIKRELLLQEAERRKLDSQPEVRAQLAESRRGILLNALLTQEIIQKVQVSEPEVRAYFDRHREELETGEVHLKQILLSDEAQAEEIRSRLMRNESFEDLARQYSVDRASGSRGGDLGFVSRGQMSPELERVAFSLRPQEISPVIRSSKGFHILKLIGRKKTISLRYEEVKDRLRPFAQAEKQREALEGWIGELRKRSRIQVYEARLPVPLPSLPPASPGGSLSEDKDRGTPPFPTKK